MMKQHLTDTDLLHHLYGLSAGDGSPVSGHLAECAECKARWNTLSAARQGLLRQEEQRGAEIPADFLAMQRQHIQQRVEQQRPRPFLVRWTPAVAIASMAMAVVLWRVPLQKNAGQTIEIATTSDAQLMADIYKTVYDTEPDVVEPLHGLFDSKDAGTGRTGGSQQ